MTGRSADDFLDADPARDPAVDGSAAAHVQRSALQRVEPDLAAAVDALPGLARVAAAAAWHTTGWGLRSSVRASRRVARAVTDADEAAALVHDVNGTAHAVAGLARAVATGVPVPRAIADLGADLGAALDGVRDGARGPQRPAAVVGGAPAAPPRPTSTRPDPAELRRRGAELLERSRDVWDTSTGHPAHDRILDDLAPDEARILLLLLRDGPQPSVDVRTGGPVGLVSSQLVAPGLTMIGARAGCRWPDQVPSYLNNLFRLGLVWFSRESVRDPMDYQVLEAQPDVLEAVHSVRFAKVVRRSIHLTPFGDDFCRAVLVDAQAATADAYPEHALPPEGDVAEPPSQT